MITRGVSPKGLAAMSVAFASDTTGSLGTPVDYHIADDDALVMAARGGDQRALSELVTRHLDSCVEAVTQCARSDRERDQARDTAWNVVADILLRLLDPERPLPFKMGTYLRHAAIKASHRSLAGEGNFLEVADAEMFGLMHSPGRSEETDASAEDQQAADDRIAALREILSPEDLELVVWRVDGVKSEVISAWTNVTPSEIADRVAVAKATLARLASVTGHDATRPLRLADARAVVQAFVQSFPMAERVPVATVLKAFADANAIATVPAAAVKFLTERATQRAAMLDRYAATLRRADVPLKTVHERRDVIGALAAYARAHGYLDV